MAPLLIGTTKGVFVLTQGAFGTNPGSVFLSRDDDETWDEVARHLPAILSVDFAQ